MAFDKVKDYFDRGLWNITRVKNAVMKELITEDQYREITGDDYSE